MSHRSTPGGLGALAALCVAGLAGAAGCSDGRRGGEGSPCESRDDCDDGLYCVDGRCAPLPDADGDADTDVDGDADGDAGCHPDDVCGMECCGDGEVCVGGRCMPDCGELERCGETCCPAGQMCHEGRCVAACADIARLCGEESELCCGLEEACLGGACVPMGAACELTEQCPVDEYCEPTLGRCVPRDAVEVCEYIPPVGEFSPVMACRWAPPPGEHSTFAAVEMTPAVANLTDDDGDGVTDANDTPDVVFISYDKAADGCCTARGVLRIVSGQCEPDGTMRTIATLAPPFVDSSSGVAVGNLHPDTMPEEHPPEIVATFQNGGTIAWTRTADDGSTWEILWRNDAYITRDHTPGAGAQPHIADLDGDGAPEVIIGNVVLNGQTGELVWDGRVTVGPHAGVGNNAFLGPSSTVADIDLDGFPEVVAGNTVYDGRTGAERWTFEYTTSGSYCQGRAPCDGLTAVGNFDDDDEAEVVIVREGEVFILEHDGTLAHRIPIPWDDCSREIGGVVRRLNEGGPPTIADFDGDGRAEIGLASADFYVVIDLDCFGDPLPEGCESEGVLWTVPNQDCSSRVTGSSVFDFDGDGRAEVVYADERTFRIFDGSTGDILFEDDTHRSNTRMEMAIVVDVDNDGQAEVVVPEPGTAALLGGLEVWEDDDNNWVRTRRIWNQHSYHVTNVTEDGQIPREEEPNWLNGRLNNFRQNVQPAGLFDAPDLIVEAIELDECLATGLARLAITVRNGGALGVPPGVAVHVTAESDGGEHFEIGVFFTTTRLLPGMRETIHTDWAPGPTWPFATFRVTASVDDDGTGRGDYNECDEDNNVLTSDPLAACSIG